MITYWWQCTDKLVCALTIAIKACYDHAKVILALVISFLWSGWYLLRRYIGEITDCHDMMTWWQTAYVRWSLTRWFSTNSWSVTSPPSLVMVDHWCMKKSINSILGANVTQLQMTPLAGNISNVENKKQFREPAEKFSMELWTLALRGSIINMCKLRKSWFFLKSFF